jgi:flagellar L-ring protein precursor FlgH
LLKKKVPFSKNLNIFFTASIFLLLSAALAYGQSLWLDGPSLIADDRPSRVGDIVTVLVKESTKAKDAATTDVKKKNASSATDGVGVLDFIKKLGFSTDSSMNGDGSIERTHNLSTTVTCVVTEVLPGGNLRLEGRKDIRTHKDTITLKLEGLLRPLDVGPDNVVNSDKLANVTVSVEGIGTISDIQNPGLLTRIFNAVF